MPRCRSLLALGLNKFLLFGVNEPKSADAHSAHDPRGAVPTALRRLKAEFGSDAYLITDVCVCAYTDHGHCGVLAGNTVLNGPQHSPLGTNGFDPRPSRCRYGSSVRYDGRARGCYPPDLRPKQFRTYRYYVVLYQICLVVLRELPRSSRVGTKQGDRRAYQMDYRNSNEALREAATPTKEQMCWWSSPH